MLQQNNKTVLETACIRHQDTKTSLQTFKNKLVFPYET